MTGINDQGDIVGTTTTPDQVFVDIGGTTSKLDMTAVAGISNSGVIVGGDTVDTTGTYTTFPQSSGKSLSGINNDGVMIANYYSAPQAGADITGTGGEVLPKGATSFNDTIAALGGVQFGGINDSEEIVGNNTPDGDNEGIFLYVYGDGATTTVTLTGALAREYGGAIATGINDSGIIVGNYSNYNTSSPHLFSSVAFIGVDELSGSVDNPLPSSVDDAIVQIVDPLASYNKGGTVVTGINNSGQIVGYYYDAEGVTHGFVANYLPGSPPSISGALAGQQIANLQTDKPFSSVTITDTNSPAPTDAVTVTLSNAANGSLSHLDGGNYNASTGVYAVSGTAAAVTAALDGLVFTPTTSPGASETTTFTIAVDDSVVPTTVTDATTTVTASSYLGGGQSLGFSGAPGYAVSIYDTANDWDNVTGSGGKAYLTSAQTNVTGGGDLVTFAGGSGDAVSLYGTSGNWDGVVGAAGTIYLTSSQANVVGGGDSMDFAGGSGNAVSLYNTGYVWDGVAGSNGSIYLTNAQTNVTGGDDYIDFTGSSGDAVSLYATFNQWDGVAASHGTIYLTSSQASIAGGGDALFFSGGYGNAVSLYNTGGDWDGLTGSNGTVYLTSAQVSIAGGGDSVYFHAGPRNAASLYNTGGDWDGLSGSNGTVYLTSAQASVSGGGETVYFSGGSDDAVSLYATASDWDTVLGSSSTLILTNAQASLFRGGDTVYLDGNQSAVSLYQTNNNSDNIHGDDAAVTLNSAQASLNGSGDYVYFTGSDHLSLNDGSKMLYFQAASAAGTAAEIVDGFASSDTLHFSSADFANFAALSSHLSQSGANAVITVNANYSVTLTNVTASSLTASEFQFS